MVVKGDNTQKHNYDKMISDKKTSNEKQILQDTMWLMKGGGDTLSKVCNNETDPTIKLSMGRY